MMSNQLYKSEVRDSVIRDLLEKVRKQNYSYYLASMRLEKIRMFKGAQIDFDFPVTAIIGPNGGGKSTILGASECIYVSTNPKNIFRKSKFGDEGMDDWKLEYIVVDRKTNPKGTIPGNIAFKDNIWLRSPKLDRKVTFLGINRTVPALENPSFSHKKKLSVSESIGANTRISTKEVEDIGHIKREAERILGKSLANFHLLEITFTTISKRVLKQKLQTEKSEVIENGEVITTIIRRKPIESVEPIESVKVKDTKKFIFIGDNSEVQYSEFNFGAGEASVIHMVADIESLPEGSLVLIEEIENGLHPLAVHRMVEYLIDVAKRKNIQTIFTTHSDYALIPLPNEAIWASLDGKLQQGKLTVETLRAISGRVDKRLAIFVEDSFAKTWVESIAREKLSQSYEEIGIYPVFGDGKAVKTQLGHITNPSISFHSICFIDGDSKQLEDEGNRVYRLPGLVPESTVFNTVLENIKNNIAVLTIACHRPLDKQSVVENAINEVSRTNRDPHLLFSQVGMKLGFIPQEIIESAFFTIWIQEHPDEANKVIAFIQQVLELPPK